MWEQEDYCSPPLAEERAAVADDVLRLARALWNYSVIVCRCGLCAHRRRTAAGARPHRPYVALGTNDLRVAEHAAELFHGGYGPVVVCTGGVAHQNEMLATPWEKPEAQMFADVAVRCGVPRDRILLETRATNTAENIVFTRGLLNELGMHPEA